MIPVLGLDCRRWPNTLKKKRDRKGKEGKGAEFQIATYSPAEKEGSPSQETRDEKRGGMDLRACHLLYGNTSDRNFERKRQTDPPHVANRAGGRAEGGEEL